ncbi:MAG TPA: Gfo/Idh/MocA family oxidoreductase [Gemmataceae bacterium]|nr:Gfo/Idh/MocA family oxidoreductase [Gemmataceae bacterium]
MTSPLNRRTFLSASAATLAAPMFVRALGTNEKLNIAVIGVADRGAANLAGVSHENVVALCDVDDARLGAAKAKFPNAAGFIDYRKLFDKASNTFDAVVVSTPDHSHALPACIAMSLGKHVYCEKPLAHSVNEVRLMRTMAAKNPKLVTQMGTQIHAGENYRRVVEIVQAGLLGPISRVHVWNSSKPVGGKKTGGKPTPAFDTDLWCGPTPVKYFEAMMNPSPWKQAWPHFHWRWWWEFGGGTLADLGCHYIDLPFWALGLTAPTGVQATGKKTYAGDNDVPDVMQVDYEFSPPGRPAVKLSWYHGVGGPSLDSKEAYKGYGSAVMFVGTKGTLIADYGKYTVLPGEFAKDFKPPQKSIPASIGHHKEWTEAIKGNGKTTCHFDYSGGLTEAVLLGNVSLRAAEEIAWFPEKCKTHTANADKFLGREYRKGWELPK